jgi:hypothetical protein
MLFARIARVEVIEKKDIPISKTKTYRDIFIFDGGNKRLRNVTNLYCQCQISQRRS